jgi:hypothetical protein
MHITTYIQQPEDLLMSSPIVSYLDKIFVEKEKANILKNLHALKQKQRVKDIEWFRIEEMLELYFALSQQKPFASLLKSKENSAENRKLVANYQANFKNNFLQLHKQEIFNILTSSNLKHHGGKVEAMIDSFNTIKEIHNNPEKNLGKPTKKFQKVLKKEVLQSAKPTQSKVKTYLRKAAYVVGALSLVTMGFLMFPISLPVAITGVAMTVAHYLMFGSATVLVATKITDAYKGRQKTQLAKAEEKAFRPYITSAYQMNSFFRRRNDSLNDKIPANDHVQSQYKVRSA